MKFTELMNSKEEIKLGFLGGSITFGTRASSGCLCYRNRVTAMLQEKFPDKKIENINAAIGGTGSDFGFFRMEKQLLSQKPDIIFVEFAVNDDGFEKADLYMENIVRKIQRTNPKIPIVFLYSICEDMVDAFYSKGLTPNSVLLHQKIADYYNIPSVNMGKVLYDKIVAEEKTIRDYLSDGVHPEDAGHGVYADSVVEALMDMNFDIKLAEKPLMKAMKNEELLFPEETDEWKKSNFKTYGLDEPYVYTNVPGAVYRHTFKGGAVGIVFMMEKDSGNFEYSIDGGEKIEVKCYDYWCDRFPRTNYKILADDFSNGEHIFEVTVCDDKEENSEGTYIRISAIMSAEYEEK